MAWLMLVVAGLFETAWALGLKLSNGFTRPVPAIFTLVALAISMVLLAQSLRWLPVGTAYAVWTGIGAAGTAILAMAFLGEPVSAPRILGIGLIIAGIVVLKIQS
jgi:quaternary ammonium compound-resistance protein SugE